MESRKPVKICVIVFLYLKNKRIISYLIPYNNKQQQVITLKSASTNVYNFADLEKTRHLLRSLLLQSSQKRKTKFYNAV